MQSQERYNLRALAEPQNGIVVMSLHQVYYDDQDHPASFDPVPFSPLSTSPEGLRQAVTLMNDALVLPLLVKSCLLSRGLGNTKPADPAPSDPAPSSAQSAEDAQT